MGTTNILLLCDEAARHTGAVDEHIRAFQKYSKFRVVVLDSRATASLNVDFDLFDAVVFHYSIVISMAAFLPSELFVRISRFPGPKILFIQDEYRWVNRTANAVRDLGISVVFTVVNEDVVRAIYKEPWFDSVRFEQTLTGFVPATLTDRFVPGYESRRIDVSYRARRVPSWLGAFGQEKWIIGERFLQDSRRYGLDCDIAMSEASRIYGTAWIEFVANSRAVLGTESGASFIDFSGDAKANIEAFEKANPEAPFTDVQKRFLPGDGKIVIHVISPRCFEAAALRTLMILYPGTYSGVLEAGRHYVSLARDHSNMAEVAAVLKDPVRAQKVIAAAYEDVARSPAWTFKAFIAHFDRVVEDEIKINICGMKEKPNVRNEQLHETQVARQFSRLEQRSVRMVRGRTRAIAVAIGLMRASRSMRDVLDKKLPAPVTKRLASIADFLAQRAKPMVKRILLGRLE